MSMSSVFSYTSPDQVDAGAFIYQRWAMPALADSNGGTRYKTEAHGSHKISFFHQIEFQPEGHKGGIQTPFRGQ